MNIDVQQVKNILIEYCGSNEFQLEQLEQFFQEYRDKEAFCGNEYRFRGELGFGGKIWIRDDKLLITCYPEDETADRLLMIDKGNLALSELISQHQMKP